MAYAETTTTAGALSSGQFIRAVASRTGFVRVYDPTLGAGGAPQSGDSANLPEVTSVTLKQASDDAAPWYGAGHTGGSAGPYTGEVIVQLAVAAADTVNAASVQTFGCDTAAVVIVATG